MANVSEKKNEDPWIRPWNQEKFDDLYNRDERFFALLIKGFIGWMTRHIILYNKPVRHFINNTGNSYMYMENIGYEFSWTETSGEDQIYMQTPRATVNIDSFSFPMEELTSPYARGTYERRSGNDIKGYNAQMRRLPIEMTINVHYVLSTMNEALILMQEIVDSFIFQRYFNINYLGNIVTCSIEFPNSEQIQINQLDVMSTDTNQKTIDLSLIVCTTYPKIEEDTEIQTDKVIRFFVQNADMYQTHDISNTVDVSSRKYDLENDNKM